MEIEAELPDDFDALEDSEKVKKLEELREEVDSSTDAGAVKERIIEELIRNYR
ncbi:MAG: hypothetical protein ABEJ66_03120 [Candidatus Nanohaloarchaea archaeon]